jgi:hypothetical protein
MWYDYNNVLSRNAMINFILTNRGGGKTYGFKRKAINSFLKKGDQFIYVRRYKSEFDEITTFFDDIKNEFPDHEFKATKKQAFIDGKLAGFFIPLSTANNKKSTAFPNVKLLCFDEFVIDKKNQRYIGGASEPILLNGLIETVVRIRDDLTIICLANNVTICNPYFEFWNIYPDFENGIRTYDRGDKICVELNADEEFIEEKIKTRWGKLLKGTKYGDHAIYNKSLTDDESFILPKKPKDTKFLFSIVLNGEELGVWAKGDIFYCDKKIINTSPLRFALQKHDMTPDIRMVDKINSAPIFYVFKNAFKNGRVYYKNKYIKSTMYDIFKYIGIR